MMILLNILLCMEEIFKDVNISYWYKKYFNLILFLIIIALAVRVEK